MPFEHPIFTLLHAVNDGAFSTIMVANSAKELYDNASLGFGHYRVQIWTSPKYCKTIKWDEFVFEYRKNCAEASRTSVKRCFWD